MVADEQSARALRQLNQPWQKKAFGFYRMGECWNPTQFYSRSMSKLKIFAGERDENDKVVPTENQDLIKLMEPIVKSASGQAGILASYGRLQFLIGEGWLCQSRAPTAAEDSPLAWEFLSPVEIRLRDEGARVARFRIPGGEAEIYENLSDIEDAGDPAPGQMRLWRLWRRHPQNSSLADSPVNGVLDLYEQLWWVTMGERSDIQNRIANAGLLLIPDEIDFPSPEAEDEAQNEDSDIDPATRYVGEMMMTAIGNPGSAAASVPGIIRGKAEHLHPDAFRHIRMHDPMASMFASSREEALIKRISIGLDLPVEEIMGLSMANHWTAWKIEDEKWQHVEPVAQMFCDDLAAVYLRPLGMAMGIDGAEDAEVGYDNTDLIADPDKGKTAISLHVEGLLSGDATLEANGFSVEDRMEEEERQEWLAVRLRSAEMLGVEGEDPDTEAPPVEDDAVGESEPEATATLRGVAEFAVDRAREQAGARIRTMKRSCEDCFTGLEDVPNRQIIAALGRERLEAMGAPSPSSLVAGIHDSFLSTCERLGLRITTKMSQQILAHAAATLFDPSPPPLPQELLAILEG